MALFGWDEMICAFYNLTPEDGQPATVRVEGKVTVQDLHGHLAFMVEADSRDEAAQLVAAMPEFVDFWDGEPKVEWLPPEPRVDI